MPGKHQPQRNGGHGQNRNHGNGQHRGNRQDNHRGNGRHGNQYGNHQHNQPSPAPLEAISAPYNFVPLSPHVFQPEWADDISIDEPLPDGLCGTLDFTITAYSPLLAGEKKTEKGPVYPYQFPDGNYGIPGSTIRGMVRNVLEIASFGKMKLVDDKRYGVRDLYAEFYRNQLTDEIPAQSKKYKPRSLTGWLNFDGGKQSWTIAPTDVARVECSDSKGNRKGDSIREHIGENWGMLIAGAIDEQGKFRKKWTFPQAKEKYAYWMKYKSLLVDFSVTEEKPQRHSQGKHLIYKKVTKLGAGDKQGYLVFTGQPSPSKHMEFIFFDEGESFEVPEGIMQDFMHIYSESEHWQFLKQAKLHPKGIPVFYLTDEQGRITSLGLSQMYRLAYRNSVGDVIENTQNTMEYYPDDEAPFQKPDLAELIFGSVDEIDGKSSLKGRVSFAHAVCEQVDENIKPQKHVTILNSPKPTYYPNYIEQDQVDGRLKQQPSGKKASYATFMGKDSMDKDVRIRGWKRYPVRPKSKVQELTHEQKDSKDVQVELHPLPHDKPKLTFRGRMRFHNLKSEELGALLWALEWGDDEKLRHAIGMGKPFGFGQVGIKLDQPRDEDVIANDFSDPKSLQAYRQEYEDSMDDFCRKKLGIAWRESAQMMQLQAMADPANALNASGNLLEHMQLRMKQDPVTKEPPVNQFVDAKKGEFVLRPYIDYQEPAPEKSPAETWLQETVTSIAEKTHTPNRDQVMRGKMLAGEWEKLEDKEVKQAALALIRVFWQEKGWWEGSHTGAARVAHNIYTENA